MLIRLAIFCALALSGLDPHTVTEFVLEPIRKLTKRFVFCRRVTLLQLKGERPRLSRCFHSAAFFIPEAGCMETLAFVPRNEDSKMSCLNFHVVRLRPVYFYHCVSPRISDMRRVARAV